MLKASPRLFIFLLQVDKPLFYAHSDTAAYFNTPEIILNAVYIAIGSEGDLAYLLYPGKPFPPCWRAIAIELCASMDSYEIGARILYRNDVFK